MRQWYARMEDLLQVACQRAPRNMTKAEWQQFMGSEPYRQTCPNLLPGDWEISVVENEQYDVFLSHNSADKPAVEILARRLMEAGLTPWPG